jgi:hypothetical protein
VKAAAAVLGASLLFFVGVLTGLGRREAVAPTAIPLGVATSGSSAAGGDGSSGTRSPSPPRSPRSTARPQATSPATPTTASTVTTSTTVPTNPGEQPGETTTTTQPAATATTIGDTTSTTTARSGEVEQLDGEVDCTSSGRRNKGREPCASTTTTSSRDGSGDRRNR